jgi:D-beta-D-heptose 7-phosphate kinase/D-beta-D-heptose 1-phosphate adenosyltransferase
MNKLVAALQAAPRPSVLIVGDLILDRYVSGDVSRISPEAPIPVLTARRSEEKLGGAGNVAANLVAMGAAVEVVGLVGDDGWGRALRALLEEQRIGTEGLVLDAARPTTQKTRMMSGPQQMLRVDWEDAQAVSGEALAALLRLLPAKVRAAQAVVLSDYGKGVLARAVVECAVREARAAGVPVLVDPKGDDYSRYKGATLVTPNRKEAEQALGRKLSRNVDLPRGAQDLMRIGELDAAVITLGGDGIYYEDRRGARGHVPAQARAVYDVTGAGDTVVAQLAFHLASRLDLATAVELANEAAAIVVGRLGTHAVTREELLAHLSSEGHDAGKLLDGASLDGRVAQWRKQGRRIVFTNGCFDVLHLGHVTYLKWARSKGDVLLVAVNGDASVARAKGPSRPVNPLEDRMGVLAALECVDGVVAFDADTPLELIQRVTPHVLVKGADWADKGVVGREWVESHGGVVHLAPLVPGRSTTAILERGRGA